MDEDLILDQISSIRFSKKPIPISANYRPIYKIAELSLVLYMCSRNYTASLMKLHFFSWVMKSEELMSDVIYCLDNKLKISKPIWRLEPSVNRALSFAVSEDLMVHANAQYRLTTKGVSFAQQVVANVNLMQKEKAFFKAVGKRLTEQYMKELIRN